jgi:tripartite-type tricarboxylate transporter receptor subunit TctC
MKLPRRTFLQLGGAAVGAPALSKVANAQSFPSRPITMIVPIGAGSSLDVFGRVIAERMTKPLGQPIIIENVSGADGTIGINRAARARPDGHVISLATTSTFVLNGAFYSLRYDVFNDFAPISPLATAPLVLFSRNTMPAKDLNELIGWLKANPNKGSAGITGVGYRLLIALFQKETGTQFTLVPYRGAAPELQDLVAGQIDLCFDGLVQLPLARAGTIRAYGVTSDARMALAPDIPTFAEMGLSALSYSIWLGLFAPKGTPKEIIGKLNAAAMDALADPAVRSGLVDLGYEVYPRERQTPETLSALVKADAEKWWPIIKELGIKAE